MTKDEHNGKHGHLMTDADRDMGKTKEQTMMGDRDKPCGCSDKCQGNTAKRRHSYAILP